jgi:uncharacterized phage protein (TIGR02220 family)
MREYAKVSPKFWIGLKGREIKQLGIEAQLCALYLMTNPHANMIGIYYLPVTTIAHEIGLTVENTANAIRVLSGINFCSYDARFEYVWVHDMALDQVGNQLKPNDNRIKAINDLYEDLPALSFLDNFFNKYVSIFYLNNKDDLSPLEAPSEPLRSQEQEKEQEQEKKKGEYMSGKPDGYPQPSFFENDKKHSQVKLRHQAIDVLNFLNEKTKRAYRPVDSNLKLIMARLKTGATVMDCRQIIAKKTREWKGNPKMAEYLRPETLFNATKFEQYIGELIDPEEEVGHENAR